MNRSKKAFTLIEALVAMILLTLGTFLLFDVALQSSRAAAKVDSKNTALNRSREGFERMVNDLKLADRILAQYPTTGNPLYRSNTENSVIIRIPRMDAQGEIVSNTFDVIIYRIAVPSGSPKTGDDYNSEFELQRLTATITNGTESQVNLDRVVARGVTHLSFGYGGVDTFEGDDAKQIFDLEGDPIVDGYNVKRQVLVNGIDWLGNMASISGSQTLFTWPPRWGTVIDVIYRVDGTVQVTPDGGNAADMVSVRMRCRSKWLASGGQEKTNMLEFSSRIRLLNR